MNAQAMLEQEEKYAKAVMELQYLESHTLVDHLGATGGAGTGKPFTFDKVQAKRTLKLLYSIRRDLQEVVKGVREHGEHGFASSSGGICDLMHRRFCAHADYSNMDGAEHAAFSISRASMGVAFRYWKHFSGNRTYPVPFMWKDYKNNRMNPSEFSKVLSNTLGISEQDVLELSITELKALTKKKAEANQHCMLPSFMYNFSSNSWSGSEYANQRLKLLRHVIRWLGVSIQMLRSKLVCH